MAGLDYRLAVDVALGGEEGVERLRKAFVSLGLSADEADKRANELAGEIRSAATEIAKGGDPTARLAAAFKQLGIEEGVAREKAASLSAQMARQIAESAALETAFQRLGIRGVATLRTEADALRTALQRVQSATDIAPADKERALAAFNARMAELQREAAGAAGSGGKLSNSLSGVQSAIGRVAGALAAGLSFREFVQAAAEVERLQAGLTAVAGSAEAAAADLDFVRTAANRAGVDVNSAGKAFLGLAAATKGTAVEGEPTRRVFEAVAVSMAKAGKSSADTERALLALSQIASKGTVSMEELRGQLGEALPGALQATADGLGITTQDLIRLVEQGQIAAEDLFPALTKGLADLYGTAPAAQTLSQEFAVLKNELVALAATVGQDGGGLTAMKGALEVAQSAVVLLNNSLRATGEALGVIGAAATTGDFAQLPEALRRIEYESRSRILQASEHNATLRASLDAVGISAVDAADKHARLGIDTAKVGAAAEEASRRAAALGLSLESMSAEAVRAFIAEQKLDVATQAAAKAAQAADAGFVSLASAYAKVTAELASQLALAEQNRIATDAQGKASIELAKAFGTEAEQRRAAADAARANAEALQGIAELRSTDLNVLRAQLEAQQALIDQDGIASEQRQRQIAQLQTLIESRQAETDKALAQANAARVSAAAAEAEAAAQADNSKRVEELTRALADKQAALARVRAEQEAGRATTQEVIAAELEEGKARRLAIDALNDKANALRAEAATREASTNLQRLTIELAQREAKTALDVAKARGDEAGVIEAQNRLRQLEIELLRLNAQAKEAEARAELAAVQAKRAALEASGELTEAKRLEIEAVRLAAEARLKEAEILRATAEGLEEVARVSASAGTASEDAAQRAAQGWERAADAVGRFSAAASSAGSAAGSNSPSAFDSYDASKPPSEKNNKYGPDYDPVTGFRKGGAAGGETRLSIARQLQGYGVPEAEALRIANEFAGSKGDIPFFNNPGQIRYGARNGTLSQAIQRAAEQYLYQQRQNEQLFGARAGTGGASLVQPVKTVKVDLTAGGRTDSVEVLAGDEQKLIDALKRARGTSI